MQTFSKPQPARQIEARNRARQLRVRVAVVSHARAYVTHSQSEAGITYRIERGRHGWTCECDGYRFTGCCKHVAAVERRAEREGWPFGPVAPLSLVPGTVAYEERQAQANAARAELFG